MPLTEQFSAYSAWRGRCLEAVEALRGWLKRNEIGDAQAELRLDYLAGRLQDDRLTVAFVAEFSRGKSELINALFFADYGDRILPSSTGRTTMCPTEIQWHTGDEPQLRLLPIETRAEHSPLNVLRQKPELWTALPLKADSADSLRSALARVGDTVRVAPADAEALGFVIDPSGAQGLKPDIAGKVEIPRWRHADIRFPHPLLKQGLVVLDTPGLNAIGAEPELTLSLIPHAHAVLFVLGMDTGVTHSDLTMWRNCLQPVDAVGKGRLVVLNKIDSLWDGLRTEAQIDIEIARQVASAATTLGVPAASVYPVSAQKALVARINHQAGLFDRSRLGALEQALGSDLLPARQDLVADNARRETFDLVTQARTLLHARLDAVGGQLREITDLRGKNQGVIEYMMRKIRAEKEEFEQGLQKYYAVRTVFTNLTNNLLAHLGLDAVRHETRRTRAAMQDSNFSSGLRQAMEGFFAGLRGNLERSADEVAEITAMLDAMYKRFSVEHGLKLTSPEGFSTKRYAAQLDRLEKGFDQQINTMLTIVTTGKSTLTQKFFETIALEARRTFESANRDVEQWLRAVMSPLETQVREYQLQLKRRLESVKRIHSATDTLESRVVELEQSEEQLRHQMSELDALEAALLEAIGPATATPSSREAA